MRGRWACQLGIAWIASAVAIVASFEYCPAAITKRIYVGVSDFSQIPTLHRIYAYDAAALSLIDTIPFVPAFPTDIRVSPSGHRLFVTAQGNGYTLALYSVDPVTKTVLWLYPDTALDEYFMSFPHESASWLMFGRNIIDAESGALIKRLPDSILPFDGPPGGSKIMAVIPYSGQFNALDTIRIFDVTTEEATGGVLPRLSSGIPLWTQWAILHPDMQRALVVGLADGTSTPWFVVTDLATGNSLLEIRLVFAQALPVLSPDSNTVIVLDPSNAGYWESNGTMDIVDLESETVSRHFDFGHDPRNFVGQAAFHPNLPLVILSGRPGEFNTAGTFSRFDLMSFAFDTTIAVPHLGPYAIAVGGIGIGDSCECCCPCLGDPTCDHVVNDLRDVVLTINVALRGLAAPSDLNPNCTLIPTDIDCTGQTDILDVVKVIDVAFRGIPPVRACDPCVP